MYIECQKIEKEIRGVTVLHDIDARFEAGIIYGLWGKNGCGKTMLMRILSNLIHPTKGKVIVDGKELGKNCGYPVSIGALIENPAFLNDYTGFDNLWTLASIQGRVGPKKVRRAIRMAGLDPDDKRKYRKYSLGMKQRLGIACAIMEEPEIVILDEPINAIDENGVKQVREILSELKERGTLVIIACHDKEEMSLLADEIYLMSEGTIVRHVRKEEEDGWK
ncbi:MAG: ATP-binding cassette domain-containing protein [Lachnospiraceae bacterium]|nr:ATP-binding cassette domain-containing protein [Lachnospiraceae bacterium]